MVELKSVVITGGGTAGHVIPAKPVMESLKSKGVAITFIGSKTGLEEKLIADQEVDFESITTGKLRRYWSFQNLLDLFRVPIGILQALRILRRTHPDVVFSKGGYVAFPVVFAAWMCRIPVVSHESDLTAGLANRLALPFTHTLCVNFAATQINAKNVVVTGTPLRDSLVHGDAERAREWLQIESDLPFLVVVGGSLGADTLNRVVREAIRDLTGSFQILHVCGPGKMSDNYLGIARYHQREYIEDEWGDVLALADVVVSRAGANALYELLSLRKPNLLVPLSTAASRGDQIENAEMAKSMGWSKVIEEDKLTAQQLSNEVNGLYRNQQAWKHRLEIFERRDSLDLIEEVLQQAVAERRG